MAEKADPLPPRLTGDRRRAALTVCSMAADATEAEQVLDMLGLLEPARRTPVGIGSRHGWSS